MTTTADTTAMQAAVADIDKALVKIFSAMPERMKRRYKLDGGQVQVACAFAMLSVASIMLAARTGATAVEGMELRSELQALAAKWFLEHTEQPGDTIATNKQE